MSNEGGGRDEVQDALALADEMLDDDRYEWAHGTIGGIRGTIEQTERVTPRQLGALQNIYRTRERWRDDR